jgi:hypothetical protein
MEKTPDENETTHIAVALNGKDTVLRATFTKTQIQIGMVTIVHPQIDSRLRPWPEQLTETLKGEIAVLG